MHFHQRCKEICELLKHLLHPIINECASGMSGDILWEDQDVGMLPHHMTCLYTLSQVVHLSPLYCFDKVYSQNGTEAFFSSFGHKSFCYCVNSITVY